MSNKKMSAEEIAKTILYFPVTNGKADESIENGRKLIEEYASPQSSPGLREALENLLDAIPKQQEDKDWWPDGLTDAVEAARTALAGEGDGWVSIKDRLPDDRQSVLVVPANGRHVHLASWNYITENSLSWFKKEYTHWRPPPQPTNDIK